MLKSYKCVPSFIKLATLDIQINLSISMVSQPVAIAMLQCLFDRHSLDTLNIHHHYLACRQLVCINTYSTTKQKAKLLKGTA